MFSNFYGVLIIGVLDEFVDMILFFLLNCVSLVYLKLVLDVCVKCNVYMVEMLEFQEVDLMVIIYCFLVFKVLNLCILLIYWYCVVEYIL